MALLFSLRLGAQEDKHSPFSSLDHATENHFLTGGGGMPHVPELVPPSKPQSAFPESPPDRFDFGRLSSFNEVHESAIKDLQQRVRDIEASVNWGRGVVAGALVLILGLAAFLKSFWKSILRLLVNESAAKTTDSH
jgi:hypothetical protein